jgi:hypothetical protein
VSNRTIKDPDGDFEITGAVIPAPESTTPLDELIRAFDDGDGATLQENRDAIKARLVELRRYRDALSCAHCRRTVLGRTPVCLDCFALLVRELIAESLRDFKGKTKPERMKAALRTMLERKLGR